MGIPAPSTAARADNNNNSFTDTGNPTNVTSILGGIGMNHSTWKPSSHQTKTIFLARHAQAEHNVEPMDMSLRDPRLTVAGVRQAQQLRNHLPADARANLPLVVCSPMRRALQTTQYAFGRQIEWHGITLMIHPDLQEIGSHPCDQGSSRDQLAEWFPTLEQEIQQQLKDGWELTEKTLPGEFVENEPRIQERVQRFKEWLLQRPESVILIVTHNGLLRHMLGVDLWSQHGHSPRGFQNAEVRRFTLGWDQTVVEEEIRKEESLTLEEDGTMTMTKEAVKSTIVPGSFEQATTNVLTLNAVDHEVKSVGYLD